MIFRMAIGALALAAAAPAALAAQDERPSLGVGRSDQPEAPRGKMMPLSRVIQRIAAKTPGKYLNTTVSDQGGRSVYLVQWRMTDGRMVVIVVDAESGAIIGRQGG
ncbi:MAG TPA: PepSY domain-containing protein [Phenylobacterium sp.]|nr:PepSY domain-containing protein [Phenylobacterium sp.]